MSIKVDEYIRAVGSGTTTKYHDYRDVANGKMTRKAYEKKHGRYYGPGTRGKK